jgi:hypothetical protein
LLCSANCPSFVLSVYICTDRSEDCVARYSFSGSHATPCTKWLCSAICRTQTPVSC